MLSDAELELSARFRSCVVARLGLTFDASREGELLAALKERAAACALLPEQYLGMLASSHSELPELARLLTVTETYFFRNQAQIDAAMENAVPARRAQRSEPGLRILSAACASGEEPYSLAIALRERWPALAASATILGMDINPAMLQRARRARYSAWSLRETAPEIKQRYFKLEGSEHVLDASIRDAVRFESLNLAEPEPELLFDSSYDLVFCRNVLMYFSPEHYVATVARLAHALAPGGFLFLGHAETLRGISQDFHLCHASDAFYYQRKPGVPRSPMRPPYQPIAVQIPAEDTGWFDAIARSSDRVQALSAGRTHDGSAEASAAQPARLLQLLEREQFGEALSLMQAAPVQAQEPDHALLQAAVAAQAGQFDVAERLCASLLQSDDLNSGAHYVLALCHEHAGDTERAIYHDQLSAYLDPGFAMPRMHMGLLYRRLGQSADASRELREARSLLEREDAARLLMFGGGFGRSALLALCDAELAVSSREAR